MTNRIGARQQVFWLRTLLWSCLIGGPSVLAQTLVFSQVGSIPGQADFVEVQGRFAYVAAGPVLKVVDVGEPSAPKVVGTYKFEIEQIYGIAVSGSLVYVAADLMGLAVLDVSNPVTPTLRAKVKTAGQSIGVALAGTKALVADTKNGLEVIDVSSPTNPARLTSYYTEGYCRH